MNNKQIKVGDRLTIHCYKHNGKIHRSWDEATVLEITDDMLVCANNKTIVTESDGRSHKTNEPAVMFFYKRKWFNIIGQLKPFGLFYYCNIATPYLIDDGIIKYIDYDLDLRVFPDGGFRVLDKNEYKYHKKIMNYPPELDKVINNALDELIKCYIDGEKYFSNYKNLEYSKKYKEEKAEKEAK